jgi:predicted 3-demethylubiquinone-9 3-methyltransferase (glyoxalase superfamily)
MATQTPIAPCLWPDTQAEDAAKYYVSIFEDSTIEHVAY